MGQHLSRRHGWESTAVSPGHGHSHSPCLGLSVGTEPPLPSCPPAGPAAALQERASPDLRSLPSAIRISRKGRHALLNFCLQAALTFTVFAGGINRTKYPVLCQAVSATSPAGLVRVGEGPRLPVRSQLGQTSTPPVRAGSQGQTEPSSADGCGG